MTGRPDQIDAACFRLSRLRQLMDEAGVSDYGRWPRAQIDAARLELICSIGRGRFRDGVQRHGERLRRLGYDGYLWTGDWAVVRYFALRRSRFRCSECSAGRGLHVHHRTYERLGAERLDDVAVLCAGCHGRAHDLVFQGAGSGLRPVGAVLERMADQRIKGAQ